MNFDLLSKNAESYSSASITKISSLPIFAEKEKSGDIPPMR